jgi:hypothetical protein
VHAQGERMDYLRWQQLAIGQAGLSIGLVVGVVGAGRLVGGACCAVCSLLSSHG